MSENKGKRAIKRKQECNCSLKAHTTQTHNKTSHINLKKAKATQMEWENSSAVQFQHAKKSSHGLVDGMRLLFSSI